MSLRLQAAVCCAAATRRETWLYAAQGLGPVCSAQVPAWSVTWKYPAQERGRSGQRAAGVWCSCVPAGTTISGAGSLRGAYRPEGNVGSDVTHPTHPPVGCSELYRYAVRCRRSTTTVVMERGLEAVLVLMARCTRSGDTAGSLGWRGGVHSGYGYAGYAPYCGRCTCTAH